MNGRQKKEDAPAAREARLEGRPIFKKKGWRVLFPEGRRAAHERHPLLSNTSANKPILGGDPKQEQKENKEECQRAMRRALSARIWRATQAKKKRVP